MASIRNSAKAIIIKDGQILLTRNEDQFGTFYLLPGGGQEKGETIVEALRRECREETGSEVGVGDICFVRDYIARNHEFADSDWDVHQVEYMFRCSLEAGSVAENGCHPDSWQVGVQWVDLKDLAECRIYPKVLKSLLLPSGVVRDRVYLGDVN